jgi:hypothetical protein
MIFASFRATALVSAKDRAGAGGSALTSHQEKEEIFISEFL